MLYYRCTIFSKDITTCKHTLPLTEKTNSKVNERRPVKGYERACSTIENVFIARLIWMPLKWASVCWTNILHLYCVIFTLRLKLSIFLIRNLPQCWPEPGQSLAGSFDHNYLMWSGLLLAHNTPLISQCLVVVGLWDATGTSPVQRGTHTQ